MPVFRKRGLESSTKHLNKRGQGRNRAKGSRKNKFPEPRPDSRQIRSRRLSESATVVGTTSRNSRLRSGRRWCEDDMRKCEVIPSRAQSRTLVNEFLRGGSCRSSAYRICPVVSGKAESQVRSEEELAGCHRALDRKARGRQQRRNATLPFNCRMTPRKGRACDREVDFDLIEPTGMDRHRHAIEPGFYRSHRLSRLLP